MKWVTREDVRVGRMACVWLIRRFVDPQAEIHYLPADRAMRAVEEDGALAFHLPGVEFAHRDGKTPFELILEKYGLNSDPALALLGRIVNGADTDNTLYQQPEGPGVRAVSDGIRNLGLGSDEAMIARGTELFDALYAYCRGKSDHSSR